MGDYISKKDALSYLPQYPLDYSYEETRAFMKGFSQMRDCIRRCDAADVVERKRGKWIPKYPLSTCSVCEQTMILHDFANFCPNCGADMRGNENADCC